MKKSACLQREVSEQGGFACVLLFKVAILFFLERLVPLSRNCLDVSCFVFKQNKLGHH